MVNYTEYKGKVVFFFLKKGMILQKKMPIIPYLNIKNYYTIFIWATRAHNKKLLAFQRPLLPQSFHCPPQYLLLHTLKIALLRKAAAKF